MCDTDEGNMCGSVACDGGIQGACPGGETEGAFRKVICEPRHQHGNSLNVEIKNDKSAGVWGGTCTWYASADRTAEIAPVCSNQKTASTAY